MYAKFTYFERMKPPEVRTVSKKQFFENNFWLLFLKYIADQSTVTHIITRRQHTIKDDCYRKMRPV